MASTSADGIVIGRFEQSVTGCATTFPSAGGPNDIFMFNVNGCTVKKTFGGIINGFRKAKADGKLKNVRIWVRRGGPREKEGLDAMRALKDEGFDINVFDRNTPLTDIVDKALHKQ